MTVVKFEKGVTQKIIKLIGEYPKKFDDAIQIGIARIGQELQKESKQLAPVKTGNLRRSITMQEYKKKVIVGTNVIYARILDQGGVIPAHTVYPKNKKVLRFVTRSGKVVFARRVYKPASNRKPYKGRGYMTPAFNKMVKGRALKIFEQEIESVL